MPLAVAPRAASRCARDGPADASSSSSSELSRLIDSADIAEQRATRKSVATGGFEEAGELCIKGPQVMQGYWQRPEATADVLDSEGWFSTGDVAVIQPDGYIKIVDRIKDMIIVSGFNVYPNELEDVCAKHPGVLECAAVGLPSEATGEAIRLYVVKADDALSEDEVIAYMREQVTSYKVPKSIVFKDDLPKTNVGKILRRELRDLAAEG